MLNWISFKGSAEAKKQMAEAAEHLSDERRPFPYSVGSSNDLQTDEKYPSVEPPDGMEVTKEQAAELARAIHQEAGRPKIEAWLWMDGDMSYYLEL